MPYITMEARKKFYTKSITGIDDLITLCESPGELNYLITVLLQEYIHKNGVSYTTLNEVIGVLECAKLELYRRTLAPYEDIKQQENGEVYRILPKE